MGKSRDRRIQREKKVLELKKLIDELPMRLVKMTVNLLLVLPCLVWAMLLMGWRNRFIWEDFN